MMLLNFLDIFVQRKWIVLFDFLGNVNKFQGNYFTDEIDIHWKKIFFLFFEFKKNYTAKMASNFVYYIHP